MLPRYARMTRQVEALIAGTYLAGTNTRRVRRALVALFKGAIGKDTVSRVWRRVIDGGAGLEKALAALWPEVPTQRCTVHKYRNLLAHAPDHLHEEVSADYTDMIYAEDAKEIEQRRKAFLRKWRLKCRGVADSLEEAGERLFTFTRLPSSQWRLARTSNAVERLHEEFKRRIKPKPCCRRQRQRPCCSGRCSPPGRSPCARSTAGKRSPPSQPTRSLISLPNPLTSSPWRPRRRQFQHHSRQHRKLSPTSSQ